MKYLVFAAIVLSSNLTHAQIITTFAGNGSTGSTGDGGPAIAAACESPSGIAFGPGGDVFFSLYYANTIRKVSSAGIITTIAGNGTDGFSGDGGPATAAQFSKPTKVLRDNAGNIYVADLYNNRVRKISTTGIISTFAGNGSTTFSGDGGPATAASLFHPIGLAMDGAGNIYISDYDHYRIRKVTPSGIISTYAGNGTPGATGDGGPATAAQFNRVWGIKMDGSGNLYLADQVNNLLRKVSPSGIITTVAGTGAAGYSGDGGPATAAVLNHVSDIDFDGLGNIYIADQLNHAIRKITPDGTIVTIAGTGTAGYSGDGGSPLTAQFDQPNEIEVSPAGNLHIADNNNNRIRIMKMCEAVVTSNPNSDTVSVSDSVLFSIGTSTVYFSFQWQEDAGAGFADLTNTAPYSGVNTNTLKINPVGMGFNNRRYRCVLKSETACYDTSASATLTVLNSGAVSDVLTADMINISPNPVSGAFSIELPTSVADYEVEVCNSIGQRIYSNYAKGGTMKVDITNQPAGVYLVRVQTGTTSAVKRLVKY